MNKYSLVLAILSLTMVLGSFKINSDLFPDLIHFRSADFGYVPYGKIISGDLVMAHSDEEYGCTVRGEKINKKFLIVKQGVCSVLQKAFAAQMLQAKMLIMIADHDYIDELHILNTGSRDKITIPVIVLSKTDGDKIISALKTKKLDAKVFFPRDVAQKGPVSIDYWLDPLDTSNFKFFYQFSQLHKELGKDIKFRIHIALGFDQSNSDFQYKTNSCVSNGQFCGHDPDSTGPLIGRDVVFTGLAMLCLQSEDASHRLTKTLYEFDYKCLFLGITQNPLQCLKDAAISNGYKITDFKSQCFDKHFVNGDIQADNDLLKQERDLFYLETVQIWPELYINQRAIRGNIQTIEEVESAVCAGFSDPIPTACHDYFEQADDSIGAGYIFLIIGLSAIFMFFILFGVFKFYYHRKFKQQIDGEVNNVIQRYMSFKDETDNS